MSGEEQDMCQEEIERGNERKTEDKSILYIGVRKAWSGLLMLKVLCQGKKWTKGREIRGTVTVMH